MKRVLPLIFLALLLIPFIAFAEENQSLQNAAGGKINQALEQQVVVPEQLQLIANILLGIREDTPLSFQQFIILVVCFIIFWLIVYDILSIIPFFEEGWRAGLGSFIVTALVGVSGGLRLFVIVVVDFATLFGLLTTVSGIITIIISVIILLAILFFLNKLLKGVKEKARIESAESRGFKAGAEIGLFSKIAKIFSK